MNGPGELGVAGFVARDSPHGASDERIEGACGLVLRDEGTGGLADAPIDRGLGHELLRG